jgi:hypothetical protein
VAQPESDLSDVVRRLQRVHGARMPEHVRRHALLRARRRPQRGGRDMLAEDVLEAI